MEESIEELIRLLENTKDDARKVDAGQKAAGARVRSAMQEVKQAANTIRVKVLELRA